jgi:hypothetical protein
MLPTIELAIIVFTSLEGRAPSVSGEEAITKWTPGALSPCKPAGGRASKFKLTHSQKLQQIDFSGTETCVSLAPFVISIF